MADADVPGQGLFGQAAGQVAQLAHVTANGDVTVFDHGDAGGIIAAVL